MLCLGAGGPAGFETGTTPMTAARSTSRRTAKLRPDVCLTVASNDRTLHRFSDKKTLRKMALERHVPVGPNALIQTFNHRLSALSTCPGGPEIQDGLTSTTVVHRRCLLRVKNSQYIETFSEHQPVVLRCAPSSRSAAHHNKQQHGARSRTHSF